MKNLIICLLLTACSSVHAKDLIKADRWLEVDLYWFERTNMKRSADLFWNRYHPLMDSIDGWKGVILNIGWLSDYILEWHGDVKERIRLPKNMKINPGFADNGQLSGNSLTRIQLWHQRFAGTSGHQPIAYEDWTYADLKKLVGVLREVAMVKYKLSNVKIGSFVLGFETIYGGDKSAFAKAHPDIYLNNAAINNAPNLEALLGADHMHYGAFPGGIPAGTPFTEFFGKQWGSLSKTLSLDVLLLRDSYMGPGVYSRTGPYGKTAPKDPAKIAAWSKATADLVKQTKVANPRALVIGYSNGASAVADWRVNCFDLEAIAKEGYLDAWIDQTWAGSWNEVGVRPYPEFWNKQLKGWTFQLGYLLAHAAMLANTKVKHYFVTETFDAWECQDIIHTAPERLRWAIWAYSHAAVKTPAGLEMPAGNCISWCNKGKDLLSEEDVRFLSENCNQAFKDAGNTKSILGPTLVYCRSAMEWKSKNKPDESIKEWIDEQAGALMKWSVPVLSITCLEYLPNIESDMFVFQTPVHLKSSEKENILKLIRSGTPVAVFGSPAGGIDSDIMDLIGISAKDTSITSIKYIGTLNYQTSGLFHSLPNTFPIFQPFTQNKFKADTGIMYSVGSSACLSRNGSTIFWDPPEFSDNLPAGATEYGESLDQILGSPVPYVLTARLINEVMRKNGAVHTTDISTCHPVNISLWQLKDNSYRILAGNLEEGINHAADHSARVTLNLPGKNTDGMPMKIKEQWSGDQVIQTKSVLDIYLEQAKTKLFIVK